MTREDMLRELELLPVWQLRVPLPSQIESLPISVEATAIALDVAPLIATMAEVQPEDIEQIITQKISVEQVVAEQVIVELVLDESNAIQAHEIEETTYAEPLVTMLALMPQPFSYIASDNGDWLFVLSSTVLQADEAQLLHNIFMAMRIKARPAEISSNIADIINTTQPKLIVAMGEATAQVVLQSTETLGNLRGRLHQFQGIPLVATYDLAHLLQALPDKARAWHDLCLAMQALQTLK